MRTITLLACLLGTPGASAGGLLFSEGFASFSGGGLSPGAATPGTLDSAHWWVQGLSAGDSALGGTYLGGDYGRGASPGRVGVGGLYAFDVDAGATPGSGAGGGTALGWQATGSDLTPGRISLRVTHEGSSVLEDLLVLFDLYVLNNGARSTLVELLYATPGGVPARAARVTGPAAADPGAGWQRIPLRVVLPDFALEPGDALDLHWWFDDAGGTGSRDELALDAIAVAYGRARDPGPGPTPPPAVSLPAPASAPLAALAALLPVLAARRRRAPGRRLPVSAG